MTKRIIALLLALVLCFGLAACKKDKKDTASSEAPVQSEPKEPENPNKVNPLTGKQDLDPSLLNRRPACIMVNNTGVAQPVQTGICKADIIFQTEVEGGETRLMAVYKDISKVGQIGSVRSARYPFVDLALGLDAIYLHHGQDPTYCKPHLEDIDHITVDTNNCGERIPNGLNWEHTLFGFGDRAWEYIENKGIRSTTTRNDVWQSFEKEDVQVSFTEGVANVVNIPLQCAESFAYDAESGLYTRSTRNSVRTDYVTGEAVKVKNVVVLFTTIVDYPDGEHRRVYLDGGSGYYAVNGTYKSINWSKGSSDESMKFTNTDGTPLKMNVGNTWVLLVNQNNVVPTFQ